MANVSSVSATPKTVEQLMAELDQAKALAASAQQAQAIAEAQNKALAEQLAKKNEISWGFSEFGKGAIVIRGFGRMPISPYPSQIRPMFTGAHIEKLVNFADASATIDESRRRGFAYEFADSMYAQKHPGTNMGDFHTNNNSSAKLPVEWKGYYTDGLKMATNDPNLMSKQLAKRANSGK